MSTEAINIDGDLLWERIANSVENIEQRLRRTVEVLEKSGIDYVVVGGNAVRIWVAQVDKAAVRATNDVDVLLRPDDLEAMKAAMGEAGFFYRQSAGVDMFVEDENASARDGVHVVLAGKMIRPDDFEPNPDVEPFEQGQGLRTLPLEGLVRMKLNSYRLKDKVHLLDMIHVGLIDDSWTSRFPDELGQRLQVLLDNPDM